MSLDHHPRTRARARAHPHTHPPAPPAIALPALGPQPGAASAARARLAGRAWARVRDAELLLGLAILALAVRLPHYRAIPGFTDETDELYRSLLVAQGKLLPLTNVDAYIGSLWNYLAAAAFRLSDYDLYAPRTLVLALGVLTIPATYALGRAWGNRPAGLLAAALLITSGVHVLISSHIAWSNCATPLFTTLAIWTLYRAVGCRLSAVSDGQPTARLLTLSGLLWGLALQTHPSVIALLPGAAIFLLWRGWPLFRTRWPYLAAGLFLLANLNLLVYNLSSGFGSISEGLDVSERNAGQEPLLSSGYFERFARLAWGLFQLVGGSVDYRDSEAEYLLDPVLWLMLLLAFGGVAWQWRRGNPLPGLLLGSTVLIMPIFNSKYDLITNSRYLLPLLPALYAGIGALFVAGFSRLERAADPHGLAWSGQGSLGLVATFLVLHPFIALQIHYEHMERVGRTNLGFERALERVKANRRGDETVVIDEVLMRTSLGPGAGRVGSAFRLALAAEGIPFQVADVSADELLEGDRRCGDRLLLMARRDTEQQAELVDRLDLRAIEVTLVRTHLGQQYGLYRLDRLPAAEREIGCPRA